MFSTPSPLRGTPSKPEGELQLLHIKIIKTLCLRVSAFCNKKNPCYLRYLRMKNGRPNYVLPRSFASLWMTRGNENKTLWNSVYSVVKKVKKNPCYLRMKNQKSEIRNLIMKKETIKFIIQTLLAILSAIATSLGVTSCINML